MTKIEFFHYMAVLLMGHITTSPWNMFINNQAFFQSRLNYWFFEEVFLAVEKKNSSFIIML